MSEPLLSDYLDEITMPLLDSESLLVLRDLIAKYMGAIATDSLTCWLEFSSLTTQIDYALELDESVPLSMTRMQVSLCLRAARFYLQESSFLLPWVKDTNAPFTLPLDVPALYRMLLRLQQGMPCVIRL